VVEVPEAARAIAPRADATLLSALEKNLREQEGALGTDYSTRFHQLDLEMHELLLGFLGYDRVRHAVEAARGSLDRARLFMCTPQRQLSTFDEHKAIVAAVRKRDPEAAVGAMAGHLDAVMTELLRSVVAQESGFRPCAVSKKGAQGLMQLMPATAEQLAVEDPFEPAENLEAGAKYLRQLVDKYAGDLALALAAYNAGPGTVEEAKGIPAIPETRYLKAFFCRVT